MREIELSNGKAYALVDDELYDCVNQFKWFVSKTGYATRNVYLGKINGKYKWEHVYLARFIMGEPIGIVDHIDGNTLNNQRSNLRVVTRAQNSMNQTRKITGKSKYKGVTVTNNKKPYRSRITITGKKTLLGDYETEEQAAVAYNDAASLNFGEYARLNIL